jgi:hypothetical protein
VVRGFYYEYAFYYVVASLLSIVLLTLYKKIYPLERSLCFWILGLNIIFMNVCYDVIRQWVPRRAYLLLLLLIAGKTAVSLRPLYIERFFIRNSVDGQTYYEPQPVFPQLAALHPDSWQVMDSEDSYAIYLRLYLLLHGEKAPVYFSRTRALGDVIIVPDRLVKGIPLDGYTRWRDKNGRIEFDTGNLGIYISNALKGKQ